jgi:prevent-host-death family protein
VAFRCFSKQLTSTTTESTRLQPPTSFSVEYSSRAGVISSFQGVASLPLAGKRALACAVMVTNDILMTMSSKPREVPAGEFKAKCLAVLDDVQRTGRSVVVTKRGRPVAQVVPLPATALSLRGSLLYEDDLLSPIDVEWDANR